MVPKLTAVPAVAVAIYQAWPFDDDLEHIFTHRLLLSDFAR